MGTRRFPFRIHFDFMVWGLVKLPRSGPLASACAPRTHAPELGIDSLAAVELMNWCNSEWGVTVAQTELLSGLTGNELVERVAAGAATVASIESNIFAILMFCNHLREGRGRWG